MPIRFFVAWTSLFLGSAVSQAPYWDDDFDTYVPGSLCGAPACANTANPGGWGGWQGNAAVAGLVTVAQSRSAPHSLRVTNNIDAVQPFGINDPGGFPQAGAWRLTAWVRINSLTNSCFLSVFNIYVQGGATSLAARLVFDAATGTVRDAHPRSQLSPQPIVLGQWVEVRLDIDLAADTLTARYDGNQVSSGTYLGNWCSPGLQIANLGLRATLGSTVAFWDDLRLEQVFPATASFTAVPNPSTCAQPVLFDASASTPGTGAALTSYHWDFNDGTTLTTASPVTSHAFGQLAVFNVQLTVDDSGGGNAMTSQNVTAANSPPVAHAGGPYAMVAGDDVSLDASLTADPDTACGQVLTYAWDLDNNGVFGDVAGRRLLVTSTQLASYGIVTPGTFPIGLRVTDGAGGSSTTTTFMVLAAPSEEETTKNCDGAGYLLDGMDYVSPSLWSVTVKNYGPDTVDLSGDRISIWFASGGTHEVVFPGGSLIPGCSSAVATATGIVPGPYGAPVSTVVSAGLPSWTNPADAVTLTLVDVTDSVIDEVRIAGAAGTHPGFSQGGVFYGVATRGGPPAGAPWSVHRIPGLDSDGGADWISQPVPNPAREPLNSGTRGTDPRPAEVILLNEIDPHPGDYVELFNPGPAAVDLQGWTLRCGRSPGNGIRTAVLQPFPGATNLAAGAYLVIGDGAAAPAELPPGTAYVDLAGIAGGNIPLTEGQPFQFGLYDDLGRLVDLVRAAGDDDVMVQNRPRMPSHWSDFLGAAGRDLATSGAGAIGRTGPVDTNRGSDWRGVFQRTMGSANSGFSGSPGFGDPLSVRLHDDGSGAIVILINAEAAAAGFGYGLLFSAYRLDGQGPFLGLGWDALSNYILLAGVPPFFGTLDAQAAARIDFDAPLLPPGLSWDFIFFVTTPAGALHARTLAIPYDT